MEHIWYSFDRLTFSSGWSSLPEDTRVKVMKAESADQSLRALTFRAARIRRYDAAALAAQKPQIDLIPFRAPGRTICHVRESNEDPWREKEAVQALATSDDRHQKFDVVVGSGVAVVAGVQRGCQAERPEQHVDDIPDGEVYEQQRAA